MTASRLHAGGYGPRRWLAWFVPCLRGCQGRVKAVLKREVRAVLSELAIRFVLGGLIVSAFAVIGDMLHPKTFAGIFGAAPSVALASLGLAFLTKGAADAATDGRAMIAGAVALGCYSLVVSRLLLRHGWHVMMASALSWLVWLGVAFGLWAVAVR